MYQTAVSSATSVSRIDGPVCITRLAMRPAKSFWKNAQLCRTTCQWFCQRIRLPTLAAIAWLAMMFCAVSASGRSTSSTDRHAGEHAASTPRTARPACSRVISVTTRPMKTGISESSSATDEAGDEQADEQALGLAREMPIELDQPRRRLGLLGHLGRLQQPFEQGKHGTLATDGRAADGATCFGAAQPGLQFIENGAVRLMAVRDRSVASAQSVLSRRGAECPGEGFEVRDPKV